MKSTLDSIFKVAFGVELDSMCGSSEEGSRFSAAFDDASAMTLWRYVDVLWKMKRFLNVGSEAILKKNIDVTNKFVYKLISNKIEQMHRAPSAYSVSKPFESLALLFQNSNVICLTFIYRIFKCKLMLFLCGGYAIYEEYSF